MQNDFISLNKKYDTVEEIGIFLETILKATDKIQTTREELKNHRKSLKSVTMERDPVLQNLEVLKRRREEIEHKRNEMQKNLEIIPTDTDPTKSEYEEQMALLNDRTEKVEAEFSQRTKNVQLLKKQVSRQIALIRTLKERKQKQEYKLSNEKIKMTELKEKVCRYLEV